MRRSPAKRTGQLLASIGQRLKGERINAFLTEHSNALGWILAAVLFAVPLIVVGKNYSDISDQNNKIERQNHKLATANHKLETQQKELKKERVSRIKVQNAINSYICETNNEQDGLLASLLAFSLQASPPEEQLTEQQKAGKKIFEEALLQLEDQVDCEDFKLPPPGVIPDVHDIPKIHEQQK